MPHKGFNFIGLSEDIRKALHKKIDLIRFNTLNNNLELINEIMKDGIKIYGLQDQNTSKDIPIL